jgi:hypothetical protein
VEGGPVGAGSGACFTPTLDRLLPQTDPFNRQIHHRWDVSSRFCAWRPFRTGYAVEVDLFPEGEDPAGLDERPAAICRFGPATDAPDPLFASMPPPAQQQGALRHVPPGPGRGAGPLAVGRPSYRCRASDDPAEVAELRALTVRAMEIEIDTPHTFAESVEVFRIGRREVDANPDGLEFHGPPSRRCACSASSRGRPPCDPDSTAFRQGRTASSPIATAMAHIWTVTSDNTRATQIAAGVTGSALNLAAWRKGSGSTR